MCQAAVRIEWPTAVTALEWPRRPRSRWYWAARYEFLVRAAALADSVSVARSHLDPLRVLPERRLPADWSLPGHTPAHDARCLGVGTAVMSTPISAIRTSAARCLTPGIVISRSRWAANGAICSSIASD